jgi:Flp pilus assembly pilin Flp
MTAGEVRRARGSSVKGLVSQLLHDDTGQDLIEYGLLAGLVAALGAAVFPAIVTKMGTKFGDWHSNVNELSIPFPPK